MLKGNMYVNIYISCICATNPNLSCVVTMKSPSGFGKLTESQQAILFDTIFATVQDNAHGRYYCNLLHVPTGVLSGEVSAINELAAYLLACHVVITKVNEYYEYAANFEGLQKEK